MPKSETSLRGGNGGAAAWKPVADRQTAPSAEALLLRAPEVARLLGISRALAYRWMSSEVLPVVRVAGSRMLRTPRAALLKWIAERTSPPQGGSAA
ncbi:MAG: helix-turn-helix domain-containing protein [Bryobacteraceae bacterium]|jgi:excisionase family DNA binding protein